MYAEFARMVVARSNYATPLWVAAYGNGEGREFRVFPNSQRSVERIGVDMDNFSHGPCNIQFSRLGLQFYSDKNTMNAL